MFLLFSFASYTNLSAAADDDDNDDDDNELKAYDGASSRRMQNEKGVAVARTQIIDHFSGGEALVQWQAILLISCLDFRFWMHAQ